MMIFRQGISPYEIASSILCFSCMLLSLFTIAYLARTIAFFELCLQQKDFTIRNVVFSSKINCALFASNIAIAVYCAIFSVAFLTYSPKKLLQSPLFVFGLATFAVAEQCYLWIC
ncbi:hypothetical protein BDR26DRAFT_882858 [Obelidium mucronatum]|nr:hypothetical protein BDR26DRAFT_882858 [Obelidium mucronatum]